MEQNHNPHQTTPPWQPVTAPQPFVPAQPLPPAAPPNAKPQKAFFPSGSKELCFGLCILIAGILLCNSILFAGFHLGFAIFACLIILSCTIYLLGRGHKLSLYSGTLLGLSLVICASFARSEDGFVKFVMVCFLIVSTNLAFCLMTGQNRRSAGGILSVLDVPRTIFMLGLGKLPESIRGLIRGIQNSGTASKRGGAIALGLIIAIPLLAIVIPLLISADAAFDALLKQLPNWNFGEILVSLIFGSGLAIFLYSRGTALSHAPKTAPASKPAKGIHPLTVNTVLIAVSLVYLVYLLSQVAYFSGGFLGILPEGYTTAEYARRGFFEMAWLCAINLGLMALAVGLVKKEKSAPLLTRLICLFIGVVTLFLVVSASAKMFLYIDGYGLTRLRVLTQVIIIFLGIATALVSVWLFAPKLPYMKAVLIIALIMGAIVSWADVDTVVAAYNVSAYQSGKLDTIDVDYLNDLGTSALPYIAQLRNDPDPAVAEEAQDALIWYYGDTRYYQEPSCTVDFRDWNYANHLAEEYVVFINWDTRS